MGIHRIRIGLTALLSTLLIAGCTRNPLGPVPREFVWNFSTPEAQGMDARHLQMGFTQAQAKGYIDALLVVRNGAIVAEAYYNGCTSSTPHHVASVSKSFLSALTGIALDRGILCDLDEPVLRYFPEYVTPEIDPRKHSITLRHLLTMRMGIPGEAENGYGVYWGIYSSANWIKTTIEYPLVFAPGERMRYNTFQTHLLSAMLTKAGRKTTFELFREYLTGPMGITIDTWEQDPQGYFFGGNSMYFTPREMAVLGLLYLGGGRLLDSQIVPQEWVELSLSPSTQNSSNAWGELKNYNYAYLWWLGEIFHHALFLAYGYGGQFIACFPELNLIVVSTATYEVDPDTSTLQEWALFDIMAKYILPSILR